MTLHPQSCPASTPTPPPAPYTLIQGDVVGGHKITVHPGVGGGGSGVGEEATPLRQALRAVLADIHAFSRLAVRRELRPYQREVARAILDSALRGRGLSFAVAMPRQAGKNETQAQLEAYLLYLFSRRGGFLVKASPTFHPQSYNSLLRLERALDTPWSAGRVRREQQHVVRFGRARAVFYSAQPTANVVGATADLLLEGDEAQDLPAERWDKAFRPMAASTNATTVLWGTMWTPDTLLARAIRSLREAEAHDGQRRVFVVPWEQVALANPAYGAYVRGEIARLGRDHPIIKTQYFLEEIGSTGGMFPPARQAQMRGQHPRRAQPEPGHTYALLLDVAGEERADGADPPGLGRPGRSGATRDATALTVVEIDAGGGRRSAVGGPSYCVVDRRAWVGVDHRTLYHTLLDLAVHVWHAQRVVIDATGIGAGLASFLAKPLGPKLLPFVFTQASKSDLGWGFLAAIDTGRFKDYVDDGAADTALFWQQVAAADYELLDGPARRMRWGVADRALHDDLLLSAALVAHLDAQDWTPYTASAILPAPEEAF